MIKIGVFGHSIESFPNTNEIQHSIENACAIIKRQHPDEEIRFLHSAEPGIIQCFAVESLKQNIGSEIYCTLTLEQAIIYWTTEQSQIFWKHIDTAKAVHFTLDNSFQSRIKRDRDIINDAQWIIVFWNGKHQGYTYESIKYALDNNKMVFNAIDGLKLFDRKTLE